MQRRCQEDRGMILSDGSDQLIVQRDKDSLRDIRLVYYVSYNFFKGLPPQLWNELPAEFRIGLFSVLPLILPLTHQQVLLLITTHSINANLNSQLFKSSYPNPCDLLHSKLSRPQQNPSSNCSASVSGLSGNWTHTSTALPSLDEPSDTWQHLRINLCPAPSLTVALYKLGDYNFIHVSYFYSAS